MWSKPLSPASSLSTLVVAFSACAAVIGAPDAAVAAEAYLCAGGRIVYVEFADLERMKRTDACVAGYYGLTVEPAAVAAPTTTPAAALASPSTPPAVLDAAAPAAGSARRPSPADYAARRVAPGRPAARSVRTIAMIRKAGGVPAASGAGATVAAPALATPVPTPGTDFRNVRVINASASGEQWFHHDF